MWSLEKQAGEGAGCLERKEERVVLVKSRNFGVRSDFETRPSML